MYKLAPEYGLKSFVHRTLALRLLIGGSLIAILLGMSTYLTRYDDIGQAAIIHAANSIERLRVRVRTIGAESGNTLATAIQKALDEVPDYRVISGYGEFVYARFYTPDGEILAQSNLPDGPEPVQLDKFLQQSLLRFPAQDEPWRDTNNTRTDQGSVPARRR